MPFTTPTIKALFAKSGNRCAKPGCPKKILEDETLDDPAQVVGQIAHIVARSDNGPRADPTMPQEDRDSEPNLILLCPTDHTVADRQENTYTVEELKTWKQDHEAAVDRQMDELVPQITFQELEVVAHRVETSRVDDEKIDASFTLTQVRDKMSKNELGPPSERFMQMGMLGADVAKNYIEETALVDRSFPDRLQAGFVAEYESLRSQGARGDELFLALHSFASSGSVDLKRQVAGLAVLVHLFRICDVFES